MEQSEICLLYIVQDGKPDLTMTYGYISVVYRAIQELFDAFCSGLQARSNLIGGGQNSVFLHIVSYGSRGPMESLDKSLSLLVASLEVTTCAKLGWHTFWSHLVFTEGPAPR